MKGQGLVEYAVILVLVALGVIVASGLIWVLFAFLLIPFWPQIVAWGTELVAGVQSGDPTSIFITVVIGVVILVIIFGRRRR